jgi:DNA-binding winged helix-turn-helix (wHTH) protein/pimeloyl-ACP methyl ester carboxylesterase
MRYHFEDFELDTTLFELRCRGARVAVEPQVFDLLAMLLEHRDRVVLKEDVLARIWPERFVTEAALNSRLMAARKAIGDNGRAQRLIRTVHGRGYRFIGAVTVVAEGAPKPSRPETLSEWPGTQLAADPGPRPPSISYASTADRVQIAYAVYGGGPGIPLMTLMSPLESHLSHRLTLPWERLGRWSERCSAKRVVVMFDPRGSGLSDRDVPDVSVEARLKDIDAVAGQVGLRRFALYAEGTTSLVAVRYAAANPERVALLLLLGPVVSGADFWVKDARARALRELAESDWRLFTDAYARHGLGWDHGRPSVWAEMEPGRTSGEDATEFARYLRRATGQPDWLRSVEASVEIEVRAELQRVRCPIAVLAPDDWSTTLGDSIRAFTAAAPEAKLRVFGWWGQMDATIAELEAFDEAERRARGA